ncbi:protocatechuate 3,4-dioxygenase subunit alpha [Haloechinothrix sp. YIM 98757]|uniref:Protocatechuate 3,4-dioxygenase subunit alpha n=1 Tax=Haloechinothrix aidingensis TaxID=2752311 RepID=A0A838ABR3_9PSEU|nr:protocatechuate 3,4-dioxygenase subunit alpha [Haloechinothrix aidingensis]MBA0126676.1 protocatechuate 3,4-dioxygenase subunit alpha [Haloechinothrix aidingensis]
MTTSSTLPSTPSQTVGPYLHIGLTWQDGPFVVPEGTPSSVWLRGRVLDGAGEPITDALVETWQCDEHGRFAHPEDPRSAEIDSGFRGFGRSDTRSGEYGILTVVPGRVPDRTGVPQAPHVDVSVFARGMLHRVVTRVYFADRPEANAADPVLSTVPRDRRQTLLARPSADGYTFDVHVQGEYETVFFDV